MTISITQQVDFLWKKLGYNVAKTETPTNKDATNERIPSSPFIPGDKIWAQSDEIPAVFPTVTNDVVEVYDDTNNTTVACEMDITATPKRTWLTNRTDWISATFGSTYQIKVYLAPVGCPNPQTVGQQLFAMGSNSNDEWYFDHESGILNFIGENLPNLDFTGKILYISGCRYKGRKGVNVFASGTFGNITISGDTISSSNVIVFSADGIFASNTAIGNVGYPTQPNDAATMQYVINSLTSQSSNAISQGDSVIRVSDNGAVADATVTINGQQIATFNSTSATIAGCTLTNSTITSSGNLSLGAASGSVISTDVITAMRVPTGSTLDRPDVVNAGFVRFNTSIGMLEVFDGTSWVGAQAQVALQTIVGDNVNDTFDLDKPAYASNLLVIINGVVQAPAVAYTTSGASITFAEIPVVTDIIEIRYISYSVSSTVTVPSMSIASSSSFVVGTIPVAIDTFNVNSYSAVKYILHIITPANEHQLTELLVVHNGVNDAQLSVTGTPITGASAVTLNYTATITAGIVTVNAQSIANGTTIKVTKTYFS